VKSTKVKVEISGGLANQIFMLLGGMCITENRNACISLVNIHPSAHKESLFDFGLPLIKSQSNWVTTLALRILKKTSKLCKGIKWILGKFGFYFTTDIGYPSDLPTEKNVKYISGYFQSAEIYDQALKGNSIFDFLNYSPSSWARNYAAQKIHPTDIAIHVRLGDYAKEQNSIGLLGLDYYSNAIRTAIENGGTGDIHVITNDINECKKFFAPLPHKINFVDPPTGVSNFDSLYILSLHNYLIIANSSFSLLAGLESNAKIVVRPTPWFKRLEEPNRLSPPEWILQPSNWR
jgi:hypothetical protein